MTETDAPQDGPGIEPIVALFADLVDEMRLGPAEIRDEAELPHPKEQIMKALLSGLKDPRAHRFSPAQLKGWLVELARRMTAAKARGERVDARELEREVATAASEERWGARRGQFRHAVEQERTRLLGMLSAGW